MISGQNIRKLLVALIKDWRSRYTWRKGCVLIFGRPLDQVDCFFSNGLLYPIIDLVYLISPSTISDVDLNQFSLVPITFLIHYTHSYVRCICNTNDQICNKISCWLIILQTINTFNQWFSKKKHFQHFKS